MPRPPLGVRSGRSEGECEVVRVCCGDDKPLGRPGHKVGVESRERVGEIQPRRRGQVSV